MVSHLQSFINSNDSASLSFIIHQARLHSSGDTVPHTPTEGHSPSVCSLALTNVLCAIHQPGSEGQI